MELRTETSGFAMFAGWTSAALPLNIVAGLGGQFIAHAIAARPLSIDLSRLLGLCDREADRTKQQARF